MGNLGRPGYTASTEGTWPYSSVTWFLLPLVYSPLIGLGTTPATSGLFPIKPMQINRDQPRLFNLLRLRQSIISTFHGCLVRSCRTSFMASLLRIPADRPYISACTCPGEDHPGPSNSVGRGAPEIDVLEAEMNKQTGVGQVVSQSAQFAPFTQNYNYDTSQFTIYNPQTTIPNPYVGSAVYVLS
jgi:hypothetical protein